MNILFLTQRVPYPPNKGDKLRSFNEIKFLSQRHDVALVCLTDNEHDLKYQQELQQYCASVDIIRLSSLRSNLQSLFYLPSNIPLTFAYFYSKACQRIVEQKLKQQQWDIIFVYCSSMAQYVEHVHDIPKVIDFVDVDSEKWAQYSQYSTFPKNWVYRSESKRLRKHEQRIAKTFQHCFLVAEREVSDFQKIVCPCPTMTPILNGVDQTAFQPSEDPYQHNMLTFTGDMSYFANVETVLYFSRVILPYIQAAIAGVKFYIVGRNPTEAVHNIAKQNPHVIVTGGVDNIQPYVTQSAAFVAPMRIARGVQNKILEAMAMGVPVVTNSLGFEGITATPGVDIFVEDDPQKFAQQVVALMTDAKLRATVALNARKSIAQHYDWDTNLSVLEKTLLHVVEQCGNAGKTDLAQR